MANIFRVRRRVSGNGGAPAALGDDPNFATTITNSIANKARKDENLADLTDAAAARGNLGLGSMAVQAAHDVNITGGTIAGPEIEAGAY